MASRRARIDRREGESSRASQANSGLVMAIFMMASESPGGISGRARIYNAIDTRLVGRLVEKNQKNVRRHQSLHQRPAVLGERRFTQCASHKKRPGPPTPQRPRVSVL